MTRRNSMKQPFVCATIFALGVLLALAARGETQASDGASARSQAGFVEPARYPLQWALDLNQDGLANEIHLYRNTFVGGVRVRNTDEEDGPFHFTRNVVINRDRTAERVRFDAVSAPGRVRFVENLAGSPDDAIVDAAGRLQGPHRAQVGRRGAE